MIDTERMLHTVARLQDEIIRERAEGLHEAARAASARLVEREEALARLRSQVTLLKASLNPPAPQKIVVPVREKEADLDSARFRPASLPRTGRNWTAYAPYAAIAVCALALEFSGARRAAVVPHDLTALVRPAAQPVIGAKPAAKGVPVVGDEDRSQEALLLVHEWILPGDDKSLGERLGSELELPGGRPAWTVERTAERGYRVTFQPDDKSIPLMFEADVEARVVWPAPETQELLAPRFTAALRDSVR
ncbi:MAG: hypothetical protein HY923_06045 [Elusimicrobia bacterium]|nr:hypothetical protein [Elusimicrobiota bacterium]